MKLLSLACMSIALLTCSCGGDDPISPTPKPEQESLVSVSPSSLTFNSFNGEETQQIVISTKTTFAAKADDSWCTLESGTGGNSGEYVFNVTPTENTSTSSRTTTIRIKKSSQELASVSVTQVGCPPIDRNFSSLFGSLGWNYGNQMDAHSNGVSGETLWGNPKATQATFDGVKQAGFQIVRIPITWMGHIGQAPDYKIEDAWMNRVGELISYCEKAGLNVIVNVHHDGADANNWLSVKKAAASQEEEKAMTEKLVAIWRQVANKFKDKGEWLMFETMNEIHDGGWGWGDNRKDGGKQYAVLNRWNQACVDVIRSVGGENSTRWIGVPGYCTNIELTVQNLVIPTDPVNRIAVAVHNYDPYKFTLECTENTYSTADISNVKRQFELLKDKFLDKGIPCYLGEFGCAQRAKDADEPTRLKYLTEFAQTAKQFNLSIVVWDNNADNNGRGGKECNAFINHANGEYFSEKGKAAVKAIVKGYSEQK